MRCERGRDTFYVIPRQSIVTLDSFLQCGHLSVFYLRENSTNKENEAHNLMSEPRVAQLALASRQRCFSSPMAVQQKGHLVPEQRQTGKYKR